MSKKRAIFYVLRLFFLVSLPYSRYKISLIKKNNAWSRIFEHKFYYWNYTKFKTNYQTWLWKCSSSPWVKLQFPQSIPAESSYNLTRPLIAYHTGQIRSSFLLNLVKTAQSWTRNYTTFQEELSPHHATTCDITQTRGGGGGSSLAPIDVTPGFVRSLVFYIFTVKILCIFRTRRRGSDSSQHQSQHHTLLGVGLVYNCFCA